MPHLLHKQIKPRGRAFTLAEVLIALTILGVIATFTIPKILTAQGAANYAARFKDAVATASAIVATVQLGQDPNHTPFVLNQSGFTNYFASKVNYIKYCNTNPATQGCTAINRGAGSNISWYAWASSPAAILPAGQYLQMYDYADSNIYTNNYLAFYFVVDLDGDSGPNTDNGSPLSDNCSFVLSAGNTGLPAGRLISASWCNGAFN